MAEIAGALEAASEWIGILRGSTGAVEMALFDDRDPRVLEERTHRLIDRALTLSRKTAAPGDGSAISTPGTGGGE